MPIAIAVEGPTDRSAAERILASRKLAVDPRNVYQKAGKGNLDKKIRGYNAAARHRPWLVLRDSDRDADDCPARLRAALLVPDAQTPALCLRLVVRSLEAWLLADSEAFSGTFSVAASVIPAAVEDLEDPKAALVDICRRSRKSSIRHAMTPPPKSRGRVGPEFPSLLAEYIRKSWRPEVAAGNAPSLARALRQIDQLVATGVWT